MPSCMEKGHTKGLFVHLLMIKFKRKNCHRKRPGDRSKREMMTLEVIALDTINTFVISPFLLIYHLFTKRHGKSMSLEKGGAGGIK